MVEVEVVREKSSIDDKSQYKRKIKLILKALQENDETALRQLAISKYGLVLDALRRKIWPKLLGLDIVETSPKPDLETIKNHAYYNQVVLDVNRALRRFPPSIEEQRRIAMQDQLINLIVRVLMKYPNLHYYQGYHDICVTFLLVLGEEVGFFVIERLSTIHLKDFMELTMEKTSNLLHYIYVIIGFENMELRNYIEKSDVGVIFCLSWVITWFGHVLENYSNVVRLYDFFMACQPLMPIYLSAAIVLHRKKEIMKTECDMAFMHHALSQITDDLPFEKLIDTASQLYIQYPPESLQPEWNCIIESKNKLLKEEKAKRQRTKNNFNRTNGGIVSTSYHTMKYWFQSTQHSNRPGRWSITLVTGFAVTVAVYAVIHTYLQPIT